MYTDKTGIYLTVGVSQFKYIHMTRSVLSKCDHSVKVFSSQSRSKPSSSVAAAVREPVPK